MEIDPKDLNVRVIDQRIGVGIGGYDTVIRVYHIPTGILIEVPRITGSQYKDLQIAKDMIASAITHPDFRTS